MVLDRGRATLRTLTAEVKAFVSLNEIGRVTGCDQLR
jgi:hypothetical protein